MTEEIDDQAPNDKPVGSVPTCSVRWERSEYPHPKIPPHMKNNLFPDVLWLRIHGDYRGEEVTGWSRHEPEKVIIKPVPMEIIRALQGSQNQKPTDP